MTRVYLCRADSGKAASNISFLQAMQDNGIPDNSIVERNQYGKPFWRDLSDKHFNISHSGIYGVCAISDYPVGVDVQIIRKLNRNVIPRVFTSQEQLYLEKCGKEEFFRLWTRKESFVKAIGRGMTRPLKSFSVMEDTVEDQNILWHFIEYSIKDGFLTVCTRETACDFEWIKGKEAQPSV